MKNHKWKKILAIVTTILTSIYGINIYTGQPNDLSPVYNEIPEMVNLNENILQFDKTYHLEDGYTIQITIDNFNRKRVILTPGEKQ